MTAPRIPAHQRTGSFSRALLLALVVSLAGWALAPAAQPSQSAAAGSDEQTLRRYAQDTWASFVAMVDDASGLPTDSLHADGTREVQTSTAIIPSLVPAMRCPRRLG